MFRIMKKDADWRVCVRAAHTVNNVLDILQSFGLHEHSYSRNGTGLTARDLAAEGQVKKLGSHSEDRHS